MDTKSLAKSKRAHSQHLNKKHHPKPTSKASSGGIVGATSSQKPTAKKIKEKSHPAQGSKQLPSNWDRYENEYDSDSEVPLQGSSSQLTDVILPKSKGSDYAYLISEAKSQTDFSTEKFPSFDDVFTDFNQGVGSLLSVRGQSISSWAEEDDFLLEGKAGGGQEASFLSMDLNALAEQLAKVDLSQRLFIEADEILPELYTKESQASLGKESCKNEVPYRSEAANEVSSELSDGAKRHDQAIDVTGTTGVDLSLKNEPSVFKKTDKFVMSESRSQLGRHSAAIQIKQPSRFEAADAEAELDMLLDSFSEPEILKSTVHKEERNYISNVPEEYTSVLVGTSSNQLVSTSVNKDPNLPNSALASNLDDSLDDLLKETSGQNNQNIVSYPREVKAATSSTPTSKTELLDDFDSWLDTI